jgi:Domain of unknown function (DUF4126)
VTAPIALSIALGIGLAAAVGLRVFLPLLALGLTAKFGLLAVNPEFAWVMSAGALLCFAVATVAEVAAFYIPGVDHALDTIAAPLALLAGTLVAAAVITKLPPEIKWPLAIIAGGGAAGLTQGATTLMRAKSALATAGLGNPIVATLELGGSAFLSALAIFAPIVALAATAILAYLAYRTVKRLRRPQRS